jgi:hypothetical protein
MVDRSGAEVAEPLEGAPSLFSVAFDLSTVGYEVDEHLVSGVATSYAHSGPRTPDGRWDVEAARAQPFTTRAVVHRPRDPGTANGTVVVEWLNVTGGLDIPAVWLATHRHLVRDGYTWVGVTAQIVGVAGGGAVPGLGLRDVAPERYAALHHPGDEFSFDIFTQVAAALGPVLRERHGLPVERVLATGASQSAMYLTTYVNAVDPLAGVFDGFLLQGRAGAAPPVGGWDPQTVRLRDDADQSARRARLAGADRIRADARAPVLVVQSETDVFGSLQYLPARQDDHDHLRLWEVAGAAHCDTYFLCASPHDDGRRSAGELAALLARTDATGVPTARPANAGPQMHYVLQRACDALHRWVRDGTPPPRADRLAVDGAGRLEVDALGIARGGVRTPWVDAPVAVLSGLGQPGVLTELFGTTRPLDADELAACYPGGRADYDDRFRAATAAATAAGFLLAADAPEIEALGRAAWPSS